ncbi:hypothetical protein [Hwangdonia seohaensis]|uniref:Uncharacterized protein n=1 Tax=Hwangdonia seohaensis TaxID=1240727 RepID=A0ABW3RF04_9FLAO|nr:hypothetical protein [Hwangdonia seohaensis]
MKTQNTKNNDVIFFENFYNHLPFCRTVHEAFFKANKDYFNLHKSFKYLSYEQFKKNNA